MCQPITFLNECFNEWIKWMSKCFECERCWFDYFDDKLQIQVLQIFNCKFQFYIYNCKFHIYNCKLHIANYKLHIYNRKLQLPDCFPNRCSYLEEASRKMWDLSWGQKPKLFSPFDFVLHFWKDFLTVLTHF